jgi:hypothetical protein
MAEKRTDSAKQESVDSVQEVDDLDNLATPEMILLSAVSGEDAQDRSDRKILMPWVKFLWESYCQCLELLRTNVRVERLYHDIAQQVSLGSVAGPVIQATGRSEFEDGLGSGDFVTEFFLSINHSKAYKCPILAQMFPKMCQYAHHIIYQYNTTNLNSFAYVLQNKKRFINFFL